MSTDSQEKIVRLRFDLDLGLVELCKQSWVLAELAMSDKLTSSQKEAIEGLLNLTDHIRDEIVEQGLATKTEVFPLDDEEESADSCSAG